MGLELRDLSKHFSVHTDRGKATVRAVQNVNLDIPTAVTTVLGALPQIRAIRSQIMATMPTTVAAMQIRFMRTSAVTGI